MSNEWDSFDATLDYGEIRKFVGETEPLKFHQDIALSEMKMIIPASYRSKVRYTYMLPGACCIDPMDFNKGFVMWKYSPSHETKVSVVWEEVK
jgi:hypothetical protein